MDCRMYEAEYPAADEAVMVQFTSITPMAAYVSLLEYNNIEGMIQFSELSRRRIRSINRVIKVGRIEPVIVLKVNQEKGHIDLSKRRISDEGSEANNCVQRYNKSKLVHSVFRHVAETTNVSLKDLYVNLGWPLYRQYGHAVEAFKLIAASDVVPEGLGLEKFSHEVRECLVKIIKRRMVSQPMKIRADVEIKCFEFDGVLHIKAAMRKAVEAGGGDVAVKVVAAPDYVVVTECVDKEVGMAAVNRAVEACKEEIEAHGGKLRVKEEARVVSQHLEDTDPLADEDGQNKDEDEDEEDVEEEEEEDEELN